MGVSAEDLVVVPEAPHRRAGVVACVVAMIATLVAGNHLLQQAALPSKRGKRLRATAVTFPIARGASGMALHGFVRTRHQPWRPLWVGAADVAGVVAATLPVAGSNGHGSAALLLHEECSLAHCRRERHGPLVAVVIVVIVVLMVAMLVMVALVAVVAMVPVAVVALVVFVHVVVALMVMRQSHEVHPCVLLLLCRIRAVVVFVHCGFCLHAIEA